MARAGPKKWSYKGGRRPNTVTVAERTPGGFLYARAWDRVTETYVRISLGHRDKKAAELYADSESLKLRQGESEIRTGRVTLGRVFDLYSVHQTPTKSLRVQAADQGRIELWARYLGRGKDPHSLTRREWDQFVRLRATGEMDARGRIVPDTQRRHVRARAIEQDQRFLAAVFAWACSWRLNGARLMSLDGNPLTDRQTFPFEVEKNPLQELATENRYEKTRAVSAAVLTGFWVDDPGNPTGKQIFRSQRSHLSEILDLAHHTGRRVSSILALTFADLRLQRTSEARHGSIHWSQD